MSKKSRKHRTRTPNLPQEVMSIADRKAKRAAAFRTADDFSPDYGYVIKDLRRIGLLAGSFIVILIVLSIVLK